MEKTFDLTYITTGLFTRFVPNTKAGEEAYREMANHDATSILTMHLTSVLAQLRKAGYSVAKAKKAPAWTSEDDQLLEELGA